jgi:squalene synthase HpnC/squalene synthase HpnD
MLSTPELEIARNLPAENCSSEEAQRYTRWLATHHYENFNVVSWLLPRHLHQHFYNVYAYCRWSDDLGDEIPDRARALVLLDAWECELRLIYQPNRAPAHPVLLALAETVRAKDIPVEPFANLLRAFRQDQRVQRYATWHDVLDYCVYSANPVGRLVLYLCGYRDEERQRLSDYTCTALQLANFWQDVSRDLEKGRIYIPLDALAAHGLSEADIVERKFSWRYAALMKSLVARTRELFAAGRPLAGRVDPALRVDIELFSRGGLAILDAIEAAGYNTLEHRPALTKAAKMRLLSGALAGRVFGRGRARADGTGETVPETVFKDAAKDLTEAPVEGPVKGITEGPVEDISEAAAARNLITGAPASPDIVAPRSNAEKVRASYAECNRIARAAHSSFYLAFYGLPKHKRNALCALYAFMRLVDNVSDEPGDHESKRAGLARWRAMLDDAIAGRTEANAVLPALANTIARFEIPARYFHDLILGAEMDLTVATYATFDRLSEYCYRVAGTVGLTCLYVFGFSDQRAPDLAERLGLAFQLTNIIRDVRGDLEMGRVYLPQEDLARFGVKQEDLRGPLTPDLRELLAFEAERAWRFYEEGAPLVQQVDQDSRGTLWALVRTYSSLLARIEERGFDVFSGRASVSSVEKVQYLLTAALAAGRPAGITSRMTGWWKTDVLAKRGGDRRRAGGNVLRRRAG